jgi:ribosomal protein L40E
MPSAITRVPIASFMDHEKTGQIIIEPLTHLPFCDMCNSFDCLHVKYAMSYKQVKINFNESLRLICSKCGNYNSKDANYCDNCGTRLPGVQ